MFSVLMSLSRPESESCCRVLAQSVFRSGGELATNVIQGGDKTIFSAIRAASVPFQPFGFC